MVRNSVILAAEITTMAGLIAAATPQVSGSTITPLVEMARALEHEINRWVTIDDSVFFGASDTHWGITPEGKGEFSGTLSLKRGGGWCTIRRKPTDPIDLSHQEGVHLRVRGDGKSYGFDLRHDRKRNGTYYEATFKTIANEWQDINLLFSAFGALHLGSPENNAAPLNLEQIRSFAFVITSLTCQEGDYQLLIESIDAY